MFKSIKSWFAWREVRETGAWAYSENQITGDRKALRFTGTGWQPLDFDWLRKAPSGRFKTVPRLEYYPTQDMADVPHDSKMNHRGRILLIPQVRPKAPPPPPPLRQIKDGEVNNQKAAWEIRAMGQRAAGCMAPSKDIEEKFITPCSLPTPRQREILTIIIEEAAEVQQRATKALRFGCNEIQPGQPLTNAQRLMDELGDLSAIVDMAVEEGILEK